MRAAGHSFPTSSVASSFHHTNSSSHAFQAPAGFEPRRGNSTSSPSATTTKQRSGSPFMSSTSTRPRRVSPSTTTARRGKDMQPDGSADLVGDANGSHFNTTVPFPRGGASAALRPWQQQQLATETAQRTARVAAAPNGVQNRALSQAGRQPKAAQQQLKTEDPAPNSNAPTPSNTTRKPFGEPPVPKRQQQQQIANTSMPYHSDSMIDVTLSSDLEPYPNNYTSSTASHSTFARLSATDPVLRQYWNQLVLHGFEDIVVLQSLSLEQFQGMCALCGIDKTGHQVYLRNLILRLEKQSMSRSNNITYQGPVRHDDGDGGGTFDVFAAGVAGGSTAASSLASSTTATWPIRAAVAAASDEEGGYDYNDTTTTVLPTVASNGTMVSRSSQGDVAAVRQALRQLSRAKSAAANAHNVLPNPQQQPTELNTVDVAVIQPQDAQPLPTREVGAEAPPPPLPLEQSPVVNSEVFDNNTVPPTAPTNGGVVETARARYLHPSSLALPPSSLNSGDMNASRREPEAIPFTPTVPFTTPQQPALPSRAAPVASASSWKPPTTPSFVMNSSDSSVHDVPAYRTLVDLLQRYLPEEPMLVPAPRTTSTQPSITSNHQRSSPSRRSKRHGYQHPPAWGYPPQDDRLNGTPTPLPSGTGGGSTSSGVMNSASKRMLSESMVEAARRRFVPSPSRSPSPPSVVAGRHLQRTTWYGSPPPLSPYSMTERGH